MSREVTSGIFVKKNQRLCSIFLRTNIDEKIGKFIFLFRKMVNVSVLILSSPNYSGLFFM